MKKVLVFAPMLALILTGAGCATPETTEETSNSANTSASTNSAPTTMTTPARTFPGVLPDDQRLGKTVKIVTAKGEIVLELYGDTAPMAVSNFISLIQSGYYNGLDFHRREEGFVIQGGDPNGNGTGGPGYKFEDELTDSYTYSRGTLAMANSGPNTNGSQFFIMLSDYPLPKKYTIFGKVISGIEVVDKIVVGDEMTVVTVENK